MRFGPAENDVFGNGIQRTKVLVIEKAIELPVSRQTQNKIVLPIMCGGFAEERLSIGHDACYAMMRETLLQRFGNPLRLVCPFAVDSKKVPACIREGEGFVIDQV